MLGPLGRPFEIPAGLKTAYLIGGGVGIPPLYLLAKCMAEKVRIEVFLGARTRDWVICAPDFRKMGVPVHIATDDGTLGTQGSVVDLLEAVLRTSSPPSMPLEGKLRRGSDSPFRGNDGAVLYICGPTPMMAAAAAFVHRKKLAAQVSLEERMGCAMGCCMGCVVEVATKPAASHARFQRVCTEGPVFPAEVIAWK